MAGTSHPTCWGRDGLLLGSLMKGGSANRSLRADLRVSGLFDLHLLPQPPEYPPTHVVPSLQKIRDPGMDIHNSVQQSPCQDQRESPGRHWGVDLGEGGVPELDVVESVDIAAFAGNP